VEAEFFIGFTRRENKTKYQYRPGIHYEILGRKKNKKKMAPA